MKQSEIDLLLQNLNDQSCIMGKEKKYTNCSILIPLILIDEEISFLFQIRKPDIPQGNEICFPGGKYESDKDDSYKDTAVRETIEEIGINEDKIRIIGRLNTIVAPMGVTIDPFIGLLDINNNINDLKYNKNEVEKLISIPVSYFEKMNPEEYKVRLEVQPYYKDKNGIKIDLLPVEKLGLPDKYKNPWGSKEYPIYLYKTDFGPIWGITAEIINEFINRLKIK